MPLTLNLPPPTPVEPVTEILHGVAITDPYRWLEEQNSPRTRKWLEEQTAYTRAYLDAIPGRAQIRKRVEELCAVESVSEPWKVGNRYFYLKRMASKPQPVIVMREGESGEENDLLCSARGSVGTTTAVSILRISRDGRLLAYCTREGGEDSCAVSILDVDGRAILPDSLPPGFLRGLVFASDSRGFYYSHEIIGASRPFHHSVFWHAFGTASQEDTEVFFGGEDPIMQLVLYGSFDGKRLGYLKHYRTDPKRNDFFVHDVAAGGSPQALVDQIEGLFIPFLLENKVIALTDWQAPNCRVVAIDVDHPQREHWQDIVPQSNSRIHNITVAGDLVFISTVESIAARIDVFDLKGTRCGTVPLPSKGTAYLFQSRPDTDTVFYRFSSFDHPPAILRYRVVGGKQEVWEASNVPFDPASIKVEQVRYTSQDGTQVPMFLVCQNGPRASRSLPTFLTGYGGFGINITPQFAAYATYLLERGCLLAISNLRGGSEFGEDWHIAAKRHKRQVAIDDFIAAAEWLLAERHASPGRIAIGGGSNAGLLVGAALTQRPDLFRAVVCLGPLLDMLRYQKFDQANLWAEEYGSAENVEDFNVLQAYSPYHQVRDGIAYPAIMFISGDADTRCNPMHTRKMAARLQAATSSGHPVLLDYHRTWGHMPVQPLPKRIEALTDRLAFICHELDLNV